jgi:hypothetical protein
MLGKPKKDGEIGGFKVATDGWHVGEFQEGIDFIPGKGGEGIWQDDQGNKAYSFPLKVKDPDDESDGANIGCTIFCKGGEDAMATLLDSVGLLAAVNAKFAGDVSPFDSKIMDGVKVKLPGKSCMVKTQIDKKGFARAVSIVSFAQHKEIIAVAAAKGAGKKGKSTTEEKSPESAPKSDDWG